MRNRIEAIAIVITFLFFFSPKNIFAEIKRVEAGIEGFSCSFCVWGGQRKNLKFLNSVIWNTDNSISIRYNFEYG